MMRIMSACKLDVAACVMSWFVEVLQCREWSVNYIVICLKYTVISAINVISAVNYMVIY